MAKRDVVVGIDIGSDQVNTVVAQVQDTTVDIIGVGLAESLGVRKGMIVDLEETISSLSASLEEAERMSGMTVSQAFVGVTGQHIEISVGKGIISTLQSGGEITDLDVERVMDAARSTSTPPNREIIHTLPLQYIVDGQPGIKDPVGMQSVRLEVEALMISGSTGVLKNLAKCLNQAGVVVQQFVFAPLASAYAVTTKKQRGTGVMVMDIGAATTDFAVFEDGQVASAGSIPLGSGHITNDLAIGLRTSIDVAEKIKRELAQAGRIRTKSEKVDGEPYGFTGQLDVNLISEIVDARLNEIFMLAREELRKVGRDGMLPAGVIFTGGGASQAGLLDLAKDSLKLPATKGEVTRELSGMVDNVSEPFYATSVGLVIMALEQGFGAVPRAFNPAMPAGLKDAWTRTKGLFKNLIP